MQKETKTASPAHEALIRHQQEMQAIHLRELFANEPGRAETFSIKLDELLLDYSKHRIREDTLSLLTNLAREREVEDKIIQLFTGKKINQSENRSALHTILRTPADRRTDIEGTNVSGLVEEQLSRMGKFVDRLRAGEIKGATGKPINRVINIGIGGSDLGPRLAVDALSAYKNTDIEINFVSNLDPKDLQAAISDADAERTLLIVASKSFTTLETRTNADAAMNWLKENGCTDLQKHLVALTTNQQAARDFGADDNYIFYFWDWVGGRYSLWSVVGMPIAIAIGMDSFEQFLSGAHTVDEHFRTQPPAQNIPVILALLSIWYGNYFHAETHAVIPYDQSLRLFPEYLSQLVMESNGKSVTQSGDPVGDDTSSILWGSVGTNAQHAFFQLLHQGTHLVPVDFLLPMKSTVNQDQQLKLVSNCLAQSESLMMGQSDPDNPNKHFHGNTPSSTFCYDTLSPHVLGMLIAIYEHKTFTEAMIWNINPFDQWGVELGKKMAGQIMQDLDSNTGKRATHDASTNRLIDDYLKRNKN